MLEVRAITCTLMLILVMALAISVISASDKVIATIPVALNRGEIAVNPNTGNVYVVNREDDTVSVISPGNKVIATIPVGGVDTEGGGGFADDDMIR
ncbi:MAG TPA: hypothetical protein VEL11_11515 [Candidatus Bathyarchaeia archaeon]|nr:hypothetical protein [Candidatus Bathyarchaeia archaeon]